MKAEILTIGDELLRGEIIDSNKSWLSDRLLALDIETRFHASVRDDPSDMIDAFRRAAERSDVVLVSGGLGPTRDDLTAEVLALVVQAQSYAPGHPVSFSAFNPAMDMRTGLWSCGNPEYGLVGAGLAAMARHYGVQVTAYNLSREQIAYARGEARARGLDERVRFVEDDYRNITGEYDVFVSIGMLEHVGRRHYRRFGELIDRCLKDDGRGLIHAIGRNRPLPMNRWIERRIFPGAYPPSLKEMVSILEPAELSVLEESRGLLRETIDVPGSEDVSVHVLLQDLVDPRDAVREHGKPGRERLGDHAGQSLPEGGQHEEVQRAEDPGHVVRLGGPRQGGLVLRALLL